MKLGRKLAVAVGGSVLGVGLLSAAALAAFAPEPRATNASSVREPSGVATARDGGHNRLKELLDGLVRKGVITQAQEDAILAAAKARVGEHAKVHLLHDFLAASAQYLGLTEKDLREKLPGTTLAAIANSTTNHTREGLVAAIDKAAKEDIAKALAEKKITEDQAKKLRDELPNRINSFVDRTWPQKRTAAGMPSLGEAHRFLGDLMTTAQTFINLPLADIRSKLASGQSLAEIAAGAGKDRKGLVDALVAAANARIDAAAGEKKLTADQVTALKSKVAAEINRFVDRKMTLRTGVKPGTPTQPNAPKPPAPASPSPKEDR